MRAVIRLTRQKAAGKREQADRLPGIEFKQVGSDRSRNAEGTGLGLALAKRFIGLHGGAIEVASEPGKGTTFTFTLPRH